MFESINKALQLLLNGDPSPLESRQFIYDINNAINYIIEIPVERMSNYDRQLLDDIIHIGNIVYNNIAIPDDERFIDNGVYDILLERLKMIKPNVQIGGEPIIFNYNPDTAFDKKDVINLVSYLPTEDEVFYRKELFPWNIPLVQDLVSWSGYSTGKRTRIVPHGNPALVGTLDKCKFVTDKEAKDAGVFDDPSVKVLERDFLSKHYLDGVIQFGRHINMLGELKYDGVSVVVTVRDGYVISAVSRGDTGMDAAVDYTPIFYGYIFPNLSKDIELDVKCEAVMTYTDLYNFNQARGYNYANARTAIIGLTGLNDGYLYRDYVTLVPLQVAHSSLSNNPPQFIENMFNSRIEEVEFINSFLVTKVPLVTVVLGASDFATLLYQIYRFVQDAEKMRPYLDVMYDGIVLSYLDKDIISLLGRVNFVNKYQVAVKFPTLRKRTKLLGISYTVGQNGVITPMAHYQPIEFLGTIHSKSSISSVKRFNENQFKIGNIIEVEYRNDVMPYVSTPQDAMIKNLDNPNSIINFIDRCPICNNPLTFSDKSAVCTNFNCKGRNIARTANMLDKLGIKGFGEAYIQMLGVTSLSELFQMDKETMAIRLHSKILASNLYIALDALRNTPRYDYELIGALGFTNIAQGTWQIIFREYTLQELYNMYQSNTLYETLINIKGIGDKTAMTISNEFNIFNQDIQLMQMYNMIIDSKGIKRKKIRVSGFRDPELMEQLNRLGYDASDKGVTKDTYILLIPNEGYTSSKLSKIGPDTKVIVVDEFKKNISNYLQ